MDSNTLSDFRVELYTCFAKSSAPLLKMVDALLTDVTKDARRACSASTCSP